MAEIEVLLPKMGESVAEATVITWLKEVGETIEAEESLIEIATDKVDSEVPAPADGVLIKKLFGEGEVAQVGDVIAIISTDGGASAPEPTTAEAPVTKEIIAEVAAPLAKTATEQVELSKTGNSGRFYSPLVRNIAKEEGISMEELETISGNGKESRVTKADMLAYIENRGSKVSATAPLSRENETPKDKVIATTASINKLVHKPSIPVGPNDTVLEMDRMRKMIADHMVMSKQTSPHVTSYVEADVTNIVNWRNGIKDQFMKENGEKITFTPIFIEAIAKAIKEMPGVNVSIDGTNIIQRGNINIGMAAALPSGNLIVPVIRNADRLNLLGLTKAVNDLAKRARAGKLLPDDIQGGTYTMTNVGTFGNVMGTPIINQPQVAIMAVGAIRKMVSVIETPQGDSIGIRHKMFLSHAYDHRIVDGALGGMFVRKVADYLESFDPNREI
ncbi:MAG: 2-oxoglutarate dehydrogenase E2 component (dihydrolipoamide succinyltransferase) [Flavobacteriales bacterium]|jgi:2-oxoglutarate dehydrogenase E2 component (dihydrolipoamide succinyltransferase)